MLEPTETRADLPENKRLALIRQVHNVGVAQALTITPLVGVATSVASTWLGYGKGLPQLASPASCWT